MARGRRPSTTPYGRGPPPHGFAAGRIWMAAHLPKADTTASLQPRPILQQMARDRQRRRRPEGFAHVARQRGADRIGRASCRDRVRPYLSTSGVSVSFQQLLTHYPSLLLPYDYINI